MKTFDYCDDQFEENRGNEEAGAQHSLSYTLYPDLRSAIARICYPTGYWGRTTGSLCKALAQGARDGCAID